MATTGQQRGTDRVTDQVAIAYMNMSGLASRPRLASGLAQRRLDFLFGLGGGHIHVAQALGHQIREAATGEGEQILDLVATALLGLLEGSHRLGLTRRRGRRSRGWDISRRRGRLASGRFGTEQGSGLGRHIGEVVHFVLIYVGGGQDRLFQDIDKTQLLGLGAIEPGVCRQ
ncbi:hypothetical protein D3C81_1149390 [compost metagenome]